MVALSSSIYVKQTLLLDNRQCYRECVTYLPKIGTKNMGVRNTVILAGTLVAKSPSFGIVNIHRMNAICNYPSRQHKVCIWPKHSYIIVKH